ncbi:unnamed protein product [Meganyctiphanes norvegica]|uniref:C-type lectin domain-containing protein n=1 Tax=Meganyctiphanes norvegica TaxID=48144 RepID=A0AAV2QIM3_MEGNR
MAVIILSLLLTVGVCADSQLPVKTHYGTSDIANESASVWSTNVNLSVDSHQDDSEDTHQDDIEDQNERTLDMGADQMSVEVQQNINGNIKIPFVRKIQLPMKTHQDVSGISSGTDSVVWGDQLPVKSGGHLTKENFDKAGSGCYFPFEPVGINCYYFSDTQLSFDNAKTFCESLTHGHPYGVSLAMLGYDINEDQALLDFTTIKNNTFWIGGQREHGNNWKWLDGREIYTMASFWYPQEPNEPGNECAVTQVTIAGYLTKSFIYDYDCSVPLNFICQTDCPLDFQRIGNQCYFISEVLGLPHIPWEDARDYCLSLSMPEGYYADLAVLGLPDQDDYHIINDLVADYTYPHTWIGTFPETDCEYKWIDGRSLPISSLFWYYHDPDCGGHQAVKLFTDSNNRTYIFDYPTSTSYPFICQMLKNVYQP